MSYLADMSSNEETTLTKKC